MSNDFWLNHYLAARKDEPRIKVRRLIYNLNGGDDVDFYGCNKCYHLYKGVGQHFMITSPDGKSDKDLRGFEDPTVDEELYKKIQEEGKTDKIVVCLWCYVEH